MLSKLIIRRKFEATILLGIWFAVFAVCQSRTARAQQAADIQKLFLETNKANSLELFLERQDSTFQAYARLYNTDTTNQYSGMVKWNSKRIILRVGAPDVADRPPDAEWNPDKNLKFKKFIQINVFLRDNSNIADWDSIEIRPRSNPQARQKIILKPKRYTLDISPDTLEFAIRPGVDHERKKIKISISGFAQTTSTQDTTVKVQISYTPGSEPLNLMINGNPLECDTVEFSPKNRTAQLEAYFLADVLSHREGEKKLELAFSLCDQKGAQLEPLYADIKIKWHTRGWSFFSQPLLIVVIIVVLALAGFVFFYKFLHRIDNFKNGAAHKQYGPTSPIREKDRSNKSEAIQANWVPKDKYDALDTVGLRESQRKINSIKPDANKERSASIKTAPSSSNGWRERNYAANEETNAGNNESPALASRADSEASDQEKLKGSRDENNRLENENREPKQKNKELQAQIYGPRGQVTNENLAEAQIISVPNRQKPHADEISPVLGTTSFASSPLNSKFYPTLELDRKLLNTIQALEQIKRMLPNRDDGIKTIAAKVIRQCRELSSLSGRIQDSPADYQNEARRFENPQRSPSELESQAGTSPDKREKVFEDLVRGEILTILHALDEPQNPELSPALKAVIDACGITSLPARKNESFDARKHQMLDYADGPRDRIIEVYKRGFAYKNKVLNQPEVIIGRG